MTLGDFIERRRKELGIRQMDLAHEAGLDIATMSNIERDKQVKFPTPDQIRAFARVLQVNVEELLEAAGYLEPSETPVEVDPYDYVMRASDVLPDEPIANEVRNMLRRVRDMEMQRIRLQGMIEEGQQALG